MSNSMTSPVPDRALDRQVAERIFDRHIVSNTSICHCPKEHILEARLYSTDPAAMLSVIEKMRELGYVFSCNVHTDGSGMAEFFRPHLCDQDGRSYCEQKHFTSEDIPILGRAVCLAACAAVEGEG